MLIEKELQKIFRQLLQDDAVHIAVDGFDILVRVFDGTSKLFLCTSVYMGGNFIPKSVRTCLSQKATFLNNPTLIKTFLSVDEENYQITLNYIGRLEHIHNETFRILLEDFTSLATQWRDHLDEHDKNDLLHVRVK